MVKLVRRGDELEGVIAIGPGQTVLGDLSPVDAGRLGERVDLVTADLSFISLRLVLPAVRDLLQAGGEAVLLVKPQFEVGKGQVGKGGVIRDEAKPRAALASVEAAARELGFEVLGHAESPVEGPAGNREWLLGLRKPGG